MSVLHQLVRKINTAITFSWFALLRSYHVRLCYEIQIGRRGTGYAVNFQYSSVFNDFLACLAIYYADHEDVIKQPSTVKGPNRKPKKIIYYGDWNDLPDLVIEIIFSHLSFEHRYNCSLVCWRWYHAFHLPRVWSTFVFRDRMLTRRKYNLYMGWQYTLDHYRTHIFMTKFAKHIQTLVFAPMLNFFSLFGVMNMLGHFSERNCNFLSQVHTLKFTFSCDMADRTENAIYGTGGQMLKALQDLMDNLEGLCRVELINLLLEGSEALYFLDGLCSKCTGKLRSLTLINTTRRSCQLLHPGVFINLNSLYISPQNLGPDLIWLLSHTKLRHLHIVQNTYTEWGVSVDAKTWMKMVKQNRRIKVHLSSSGKPKNEIIWQERAPVSSILYESPYSKVNDQLKWVCNET